MSQEVHGRYLLLLREVSNLKEKIAKSVFYFQKLKVDEDTCSSSSSSDENDESPDCSSAEEEERDGASEEME
jgi:hypothetical protein